MTTPKIHILYDLKKGASGGGNHFLNALKQEWIHSKCYADSWQESDIVLLNSIQIGQESKFLTALRAHRRPKTIIHRIAGPFKGYRPNDGIRDRCIYTGNALFSHGNIFQSEWSRQANYKEGLKSLEQETVLLNAPDPRYFYPNPAPINLQTTSKIKLFAMSWSPNELKGFDCLRYLDKHLDYSRYEFTFVGNSPTSFSNICQLPPLSPQELGDALRQHHIFLFPSKIEACSNALLQGLHCGLPTIAYNGSSNPEIVQKQGLLFTEPSEVPGLLKTLVRNTQQTYHAKNLPSMSELADSYFQFCLDTHEKRLSGKIQQVQGFSRLRKVFDLGCILTKIKLRLG